MISTVHAASYFGETGVPAFKGRGAGFNPPVKFSSYFYQPDSADLTNIIENEEEEITLPTKLIPVHASSLLHAVNSPDLNMNYSLNVYQGCEHGCSYCYARPTHEYWGMSAGLDFEQTVFYKENAPELLEQELKKKKDALPVAMSGNTDCYQPAEKKLQLTHRLLKIFLDYRHPVCIITKNSLILRDLDILKQLAEKNLVFVYISINTIDEELRRKMEPRTASVPRRFQTLEKLSREGIPCGVLMAPVILGLNNMHIPAIIKKAWECGAADVSYSVVRLNDIVSEVFRDWLWRNLPERAEKVWNLIKTLHGGSVSNKTFGERLTGKGPLAEMVHQLFKINKQKYHFKNTFSFNTNSFNRIPSSTEQLSLFEEYQ